MSTKPDHVTLTPEQAQALQARIQAGQLTAQDTQLLIGLVKFNLWLQHQLSTAKLTIQRLKRLFGFRTEKKSL